MYYFDQKYIPLVTCYTLGSLWAYATGIFRNSTIGVYLVSDENGIKASSTHLADIQAGRHKEQLWITVKSFIQ